MLRIKLKGITNAAAWSQIFCLGMGTKGKYSFFSEHGHIAYLFKRNHECSHVVANTLCKDPIPLRPLKLCQLFQNMVMFHIEFKGITNAATW